MPFSLPNTLIPGCSVALQVDTGNVVRLDVETRHYHYHTSSNWIRWRVRRDSTNPDEYGPDKTYLPSSWDSTTWFLIDAPSAGSHTYTVEVYLLGYGGGVPGFYIPENGCKITGTVMSAN